MIALTQLHTEIDERVQNIRTEYPDWLCRRGCDRCCHRLAEIPRLTEQEWALLRQGLSILPQERLQSINQKIILLAKQAQRPFVCPLLDQHTGSCEVYIHRPTACRTYGFYRQRDKGLYCSDIESQVTGGVLENVVWGNQDVVDQQLKNTGKTRDLTEWFADWIA